MFHNTASSGSRSNHLCVFSQFIRSKGRNWRWTLKRPKTLLDSIQPITTCFLLWQSQQPLGLKVRKPRDIRCDDDIRLDNRSEKCQVKWWYLLSCQFWRRKFFAYHRSPIFYDILQVTWSTHLINYTINDKIMW